MFSIKTLLSRSLLKPSINPHKFLRYNPILLQSWSISLSTQIPKSSVPSSEKQPQISSKNGKLETKNKRPLDVLFKEALGLCEKGEIMSSLSEENGENSELMKKLFDLEMEVRQLKASSGGSETNLEEMKKREDEGEADGVSDLKPKSLLDIFGCEMEGENSSGKKKEVVFKEISQDMQVLLRQLFDKGYFKNVNFMHENKFDMSYFYEEYPREFVKSALDRFGKDHHEIAKWLSGSDVKSIALFGCPTVSKRDVFAAKKLRNFFKIDEETVCAKCVVKDSCKFVNQSIWKGDNTTLRLDSLLRILRAYSLEEIPPQLKLTEDVKACVSRLIHEVVNLSRSVSETASVGGVELDNGQ